MTSQGYSLQNDFSTYSHVHLCSSFFSHSLNASIRVYSYRLRPLYILVDLQQTNYIIQSVIATSRDPRSSRGSSEDNTVVSLL